MIAAQLRGRVHLKSKEFANQQHILVFSHILGVLDLLRPHIFRQDKVWNSVLSLVHSGE